MMAVLLTASLVMLFAGRFLCFKQHDQIFPLNSGSATERQGRDANSTGSHRATARKQALVTMVATKAPVTISPELELAPPLQTTYRRLKEFAETGDLSPVANMNAADIRALADHVANAADRALILSLLEAGSKMPSDLVPENPQALADFLVKGFYALRGDKEIEEPCPAKAVTRVVSPIAFSATKDEAGRILATSATFESGVMTIHGVFENHAWPPGISRVFAVWRNIDQNKVVFQETEEIVASTDSNHVWLKADAGWPAGHWQMDLFDPQREFALLATGNFDIQ
jgi:hypothetical protein